MDQEGILDQSKPTQQPNGNGGRLGTNGQPSDLRPLGSGDRLNPGHACDEHVYSILPK